MVSSLRWLVLKPETIEIGFEGFHNVLIRLNINFHKRTIAILIKNQTSFDSRKYLNQMQTIGKDYDKYDNSHIIIKSCSDTCLSLPGDPRMISGFSSIHYPIPSQSLRNTPLIWIRNWLFLFSIFAISIRLC